MAHDLNALIELPKKLAGQQITRVELDSKYTKAWTETRALLLWQCPAFSHLLYSMMSEGTDNKSAIFTTDVPIAATDGVNMLLNPEPFFKYNLHERVFILAHEIMHCMWDHCGQMWQHAQRKKISNLAGKSLPYNHGIMNIALDHIINDALVKSKVGSFNKDWIHDPSKISSTDSYVDAYFKLYDDMDGGKGGKGGQGQGFDNILNPGTGQGKDPTTTQQQRSDVQWKTEVAKGLAQAKMQGKLPEELERLFGELLEPKVDWQDKIKSFFARRVGSGSTSWRRPDRRLIVRDIYAPGRTGHGAGLVVVAIDTSGSVGQAELDVFFAELRGILEDVRPTMTKVVWCDAKVHGVDDIEDPSDVGGLKAKGGGGTDFRPVFDLIAKEGWEPDALVYLTDLYGSFPARAPGYPVLWGRTSTQDVPWGDVVDVPLK